MFAPCFTNIAMKNISAIIFDLGGVLLNLDVQKTIDAMIKLGANHSDVNLNASLFTDFEMGKITPALFLSNLKTTLPSHVTNKQITDAWNAMLLDMPNHRIAMLIELKKRYKIYLFSNTNDIHITHFNRYFKRAYPHLNWHLLFDHVFYSYQMGLRKPDVTAFELVLKHANINASQCLFIDDNLANINGAKLAGIHTHYLSLPTQQIGTEMIINSIKQLVMAYDNARKM